MPSRPFLPARLNRRRTPDPVQKFDDLVEFLREETSGGKFLLIATAVALLWANLAGDSYTGFWSTHLNLGPAWLELDLDLAKWAGDGLLAVFFLVAGLELKRELTVGELAGWRAAALPLFAAAGGMVVPAVVAIVASRGALIEGGAWSIPVATDIAFALGVLALAGSALPSGVRVLLLSMAVIDDLGAITLIAVLFSVDLQLAWLAGGLALCLLYGYLMRRRTAPWWLIVPIMLAAWVCVHASGVHATVTGIALGLLTPVHTIAAEHESPAERLEHRLHPWSAAVVVPIFALSAAGIPLAAAGEALSDPVAHGIVAGLLVGKVVGVMGGAWLAVRLRLGNFPENVSWGDVLPVAMLAGVGYTVSLLIARLSLSEAAADRASAAVLAASVAASLIAVVLLRLRTRVYVDGPE
jgi:NhaA family Na+:H+ antiporter